MMTNHKKFALSVGYFKHSSLNQISKLKHLALLSIAFFVIFSVSTSAQVITEKIKSGSIPAGIRINTETNLIYVSNSGDNTVSVIDGLDNQVIDTIVVGLLPKGVAINTASNRIYITNSVDNTVSVIDSEKNEVISTVDVGEKPLGIDVNPLTNLIYVVNSIDNTLDVIDGTSNLIIDHVDLPPIREIDPLLFEEISITTNGIAIIPELNSIYVTQSTAFFGFPSEFSNDVIVIKGSDTEIIERINLSTGDGDLFFAKVYGIGVDLTTNLVYVADRSFLIGKFHNNVTVIDGLTNNVIENFPVKAMTVVHNMEGAPFNAFGLIFNPTTQNIYIADPDNNIITILDSTTKEIVSRIRVEDSPTGVTSNPRTNLIYVTNNKSNDITVIRDEQQFLDNLIVNPSVANSSLRLKEAVVTALDQGGQPLSGITINASTSGSGTTVNPASSITDIDGIAKFKFKFKFGFTMKEGQVKFNANGINANIKQKTRILKNIKESGEKWE